VRWFFLVTAAVWALLLFVSITLERTLTLAPELEANYEAHAAATTVWWAGLDADPHVRDPRDIAIGDDW
jgi:predicted cobalt transporter CbtA